MLDRTCGAAARTLAAMIAVVTLTAQAYSQEAYMELLRSDLRTQKTAILTQAMELSNDEASKFWPIYREYELELSKLGDRRIAFIKDYAANYQMMTDEKSRELAEGSFKLEEQETKLKRKYFKQVEKALNSTTAARFIQVENVINRLVLLQVGAELPLIRAPEGGQGN